MGGITWAMSVEEQPRAASTDTRQGRHPRIADWASETEPKSSREAKEWWPMFRRVRYETLECDQFTSIPKLVKSVCLKVIGQSTTP
jgi:hypothetical protein